MKKLYWRPSRVPRVALLFTSVVSVAFIAIMEWNPVHRQLPHYQEKIRAATIMKSGMELIKKERERRFGPINKKLDPAQSGLIGLTISPITSNTGYLNVKQTSVNPNWAAAMVMMLTQVKAKPGNYVAIGTSGSFPALTLAALAAMEVLGLKAITITSVAASNWGANIPEFTWLDMEKILYDEGLISTRSIAASLGGTDDSAAGISESGIAAIMAAIGRAKVKFLTPKSLVESIDERMALYREFSGGDRIAAYINIGGGVVSVGSPENKKSLLPGVNKGLTRKNRGEGIINRFHALGVPVIHISHVDKLAEQYGLPKGPRSMVNVGEGEIFQTVKYDKTLAICLLLLLFAIMYTLLRLDIGYRIFGIARTTPTIRPPEPMV